MTKYTLASDTWNEKEISAIHRVIESGRYTMGPEVAKYEEDFASFFNVKHAVMTNSGSSANLLMLATLYLHPKFKKISNPNIIVPTVSWSTTFFPVQQYGYTLKFVDVNANTFNLDVDTVRNNIDKNTVAVFAVNLLGNPCQLQELKNLCEEKNIILLEDNCESLGAIETNNKLAGTFGTMGSFSFFFSHHLQTMEGGMVVTDDDDLVDYLKSIRAHGWVRDVGTNSKLYTKTGDPFEDSFRFVLPGYCVRPLEMSGAIGQEQLKKWPDMFVQRRKNAEICKELFSNLDYIELQREHETSSWFGFGLVVKGKLTNKRKEVIEALMNNGVESRPIVAGNFLRNPVIKHINYIAGETTNADILHDRGFFIGNDIRNLESNLVEVKKIIEELL